MRQQGPLVEEQLVVQLVQVEPPVELEVACLMLKMSLELVPSKV